MRSYADEGKGADDACLACGLSVLTRAEDVLLARKAMPWFKKRFVTRASLGAEHGKIKQTGAHRFHYSLWVRARHASRLHSLFEVEA